MWSCVHFTSQYAEILQKQYDDPNLKQHDGFTQEQHDHFVQKQHDHFNRNLHNDHSHWRSHIMTYYMFYAEISEKQHDD